MRKFGCWIALLWIQGAFAVVAAAEDEWQRLAERIPHVDYSDFLYNRLPLGRNVDPSKDRPDSEGLAELRELIAMKVDLAELKRRAEDEDSRIRTLALMKLYVSGNPDAFRVIHSRLNDSDAAFPSVSRFTSQIIDLRNPTSRKIPTDPMGVGQLARKMLEMMGYRGNEDFEAWAKPRFGNPEWMGWYQFLLKRITQGTSPIPKGIDDEIAAFKKLLDEQSPALRAWLGFVVGDEAMSVPTDDTVLGGRDELIERGKALGPEALLGFLRDGTRVGLKDPHVDRSEAGKRFVLRHARHFFRDQDAEALREMGHFIAATDARPKMASVWIREACAKWSDKYQGWDRAMAMAALLEYRGADELKFVVDWFYETEPANRATSDHSMFIHEYERRQPADWKTAWTALAAHSGFDSMEPMVLCYFGIAINKLSGQPLIKDQLFREERETELRNAIRRCLGLPEKEIKWLDLDVVGERLEPEWSVPLEGRIDQDMAIHPEGTSVAIKIRDGKIRIHAIPGGAILDEIPADPSGIGSFAFRRADGRLMVTRRGGIDCWDVKPLRRVEQLELEGFAAPEVCFGPDALWLATREANDVGVSVWDLQTRTKRWKLPMPVRAFGLIGASPDGSRFAVCNSFARTVMLFDPANAVPLAQLKGHSGIPMQVAFSTDAETFATSGEDTKVMLWYAKTGERLAEYHCSQRQPRLLLCSGDSTSFLFGGSIGKITRVDLTEGRVIGSLLHEGTWSQSIARARQKVVAVVHDRKGGSILVGWRLRNE